MKNAPTSGATRKARGAGAVALHQRAHHRHRIGRGAQHEADEAAAHHRRLVVAPHAAEHEHRAERRPSRTCSHAAPPPAAARGPRAPTASGSSAPSTRNSDSATAPMRIQHAVREPEPAETVIEVADQRGHQHRADVGRQRDVRCRRIRRLTQRPDPHRDQQRDHALQQREDLSSSSSATVRRVAPAASCATDGQVQRAHAPSHP